MFLWWRCIVCCNNSAVDKLQIWEIKTAFSPFWLKWIYLILELNSSNMFSLYSMLYLYICLYAEVYRLFTKVGWKVHRMTMMLWFSFQHTCSLPCGPPHTPSIGVAAFESPWYRSSYPDPKKKKKSSSADMTSSLVLYCFPGKCLWDFFFTLGNRNQIRIRVINYFKPQSRLAGIATTNLYAGALSWWNRTPFVNFLRNVSSTSFQSPELLIQYGFIWKETNTVSILEKGWM